MASKEYVAWATVDSFYDTQILPDLMAHLDQHSAISAYRNDLSGNPPMRRVQTIVNILVMRLLFPRFHFKAYHTLQIHRVDFIRAIQIEAVTSFICSELLFKAASLGLSIKELGIDYQPRKKGKATGGNPKLIIRYLREVLRFWLRWALMATAHCRPTVSVPARSPSRGGIEDLLPAAS